MKKGYSLLSLIMCFVMLKAMAQTTLSVGDIALINLNTDDEKFAFVTLVDLSSGTQIYFTDEEPAGGSVNGGEGIVLYTAPSLITKGTVIEFTATSTDFSPVSSSAVTGSLVLGNSGDGVTALQGFDASTGAVTTFLHQIGEDAGDVGTTNGLTNADKVLLGADNGQYSGTRSGTAQSIYTAVGDIVNYTTSGNFGGVATTTTAFTVMSSGGPALSATITVDSNVTCNGFSNGGASASAMNGTMPYTYLWSNTATTASITGVTAGTYSVIVTDNSGAKDTATATITEPAVVVAAAVVDSNVTCNGAADGGSTASATGGTMPFTYTWSNGATTASITGAVASTYTVTITDANGCTDSETTTITEPTALIATTLIDSTVSCNGFSDGGATASATTGTAPYTYVWSNGATNASITGVASGTYTVTITDNNGCTDSENVIITEPTVLVAAAVVDSNVTTTGGSDGGATASATGGTTPYTFLWSNSATTAGMTGVSAGTYTVTITDNNGCTDTETATITEPAGPMLATTVRNDSNVSCNGGATGGLTALPTGGATPYTYLWSNGATSTSITGVVAGTYTVTITDNATGSATASGTITEPTALTASISTQTNVACNGGSGGAATANGAGGSTPYTYAWSNAATTATINAVTAGTYTVTITDANGCTNNTSVTITEPAALVSTSVLDSNVTCNSLTDGGATTSATGGTGSFTYAWSNGATTAAITGVAAGNYFVTVTDANGCTDSSSVVITEPAVLVSAAVVDSNVSVNGLSDGGATASATGGIMNYNYLWSNSATTASITGVVAGDYFVTVTDANGCTDSSSVTITQPAPVDPYYPIAVLNTEDANGIADSLNVFAFTSGTVVGIDLDGNNGLSFTIVDNSTGVQEGMNIYNFNDVSNYVVTEGDSILVHGEIQQFNGLTELFPDSISVISTGNSLPTPIVVTDLDETTESRYLNISSNFVSLSTSGSGSSNISMTNGVDTLVMRIDSDTDIIDSLTATMPIVPGDTICGVVGVGGQFDSSNPYTSGYQIFPMRWSDLTICRLAALTTTTSVDSNVTCNGATDGGATVNATFGLAPYSYAWSNTATTASITGVAAGTYLVTVTDANGTTALDSATITEPNVLVATAVVDSNVTVIGGNDGGATVSATGGTMNYSYLWSNSATTASITAVIAGTYVVTVTDANGCSAVDSVSITEPAGDPYYPIAILNTEDANGVADSLNVFAFTSGTVVGVDIDGNAGLSFTIVDQSTGVQEGMNIYNFADVSNYVVTEGDSILVHGEIQQFNGLTELFPDSISVISTGNSLPTPLVVSSLDETTESKYISIPTSFVSLSTSGTGSSNISMTNGVDTLVMRIDSDTDIIDSLTATMPIVPGDTICGVVGVGGQFDSSNPYTSGYQIFPMRWSDLTICRLAVGIEDNEVTEASFNVYPNPTSGQLTIAIEKVNFQDRLQVIDMTGKVLRDELVNQSKLNVDLSSYSNGIYFVRIGELTKKIVLNK